MSQPSLARAVRKPPSRYHHGDLRRALVQEAVRTIREKGIDALTLREAGRKLGVSRTALYRHFADKSTLLAAVAREGFQRFRDDLQQAWAVDEGSRRALDGMGVTYVRFAIRQPAHYRVMFGDYRHLCAKDPELQADAKAAFDVLVGALLSLQRSGQVRRDDPLLMAQYIWAVVHGIAMLAIDGQLGPDPAASPDVDRILQFAIDRLWSGIAR
jgi:AcrR family transcriptional regulator